MNLLQTRGVKGENAHICTASHSIKLNNTQHLLSYTELKEEINTYWITRGRKLTNIIFTNQINFSFCDFNFDSQPGLPLHKTWTETS